MNHISIKDCPADTILEMYSIAADQTEKKVSVFVDSSDDWSALIFNDELYKTFGFFGRALIKDLLADPTAVEFKVQRFHVINGHSKDIMKLKPFYNHGGQYRIAHIDRKGNIKFFQEDQI